MAETRWEDSCAAVNTCALTGAAAFFAGIPDAVLVCNGPLWCYYHALRYLEQSCPGLSQRFFCTQPDNNAVIYGTEDCLAETLRYIKEKTRPSLIFIENSCAISLIGDDSFGIARQANLSCPVIVMDGNGLTGGFREGYQGAARAFFKAAPLRTGQEILPQTVNLLGCSVGYYNAGNDLTELKRLLNLEGFQVLTAPGRDGSYEAIMQMARAKLNIVVHEELGGEIAEYLHRQYGMPYLTLLPPYGITASLEWLQRITETVKGKNAKLETAALEADDLKERLQHKTQEIRRLWGELWFENTVVAASCSVACGVSRALRREWADTGHLTIAVPDGQTPACLQEGVDQIIDTQRDSVALEKELVKLDGGLLFGSSNETNILMRQGISAAVTLNIALPVYDEVLLCDLPFMGLKGACHLQERLWNYYIRSRLQGH
jgi:nitrogenase molybdenum-iron protein alpha/beta subunit